MATIETKIAKNGSELYYVDKKRVSRAIALEAAANNRKGNLFTIETGSWNDYTKTIEYKTLMRTAQCPIKIQQENKRYDIIFRVLVDNVVVKSFYGHKNDSDAIKQAKQYATILANKIAAAYIRGAYGIKVLGEYHIEILNAPAEADVNDYAVTADAQQAAIDAEQAQAVNNTDSEEVITMTTTTKEARKDYSFASLHVECKRINGRIYWYGDIPVDNLSIRTRESTGRGRISKNAAVEILAKYGITPDEFIAYY